MAAVNLCAVLPALPANAPASFHEDSIARKLVVGDDFGDRDIYYFWDDHPDVAVGHRGRWHKHMSRTDAQGRHWSCTAGEFVMDDFGFLVEVKS